MDTQRPGIIFERVAVEGGAIVRKSFPNARHARVVQQQHLAARWGVGAEPRAGDVWGQALDDPVGLALSTGGDVWFDFSVLSSARPYAPLVVELANVPSVVYAPAAPHPAPIARNVASQSALAIAESATTVIWTNSDATVAQFSAVSSLRAHDRYFSGVLHGTGTSVTPTAFLQVQVGASWFNYATGTFIADGSGGWLLVLDTMLFSRQGANSVSKVTALGTGSGVVQATDERAQIPVGVQTRLVVTNNDSDEVLTLFARVSTLSA